MTRTLVIAVIGGKRCAFHAEDVASVIETGEIVPIPRAPGHILGLTALRSRALAVLDCRIAIGCADAGQSTDNRAIVVSHAGHSFALVVDRIEDIAEDMAGTQPPPATMGPQWSRVSTGMLETASGPALLLDIPALVTGQASPARAA